VTILDELSSSRCVSLTTYRKDGSSVATPVWHVVHDSELFIATSPESWKVKRIRNDDRVVVTVCDARGRIAERAPSVAGTARLLDTAGTDHVHRLLARKYLAARLLLLVQWYRPRPSVGIAVSFPHGWREAHHVQEHSEADVHG
jgi:uncharacterized protein